MNLTSTLYKKGATWAIVHVTIEWDLEAADRPVPDFFLVGFDTLTGSANVSAGTIQGKTQVSPDVFEGDYDSDIEQQAIIVVIDFLRNQNE